MAVTAADVKKLRDATGAGMMDAKKALQEADGDHSAASQLLRERGLSKMVARSDRENSEGAVGTFLDRDKGVAALVELKCETDFVAKNPDFVNMAHELAALVAEGGEEAVAQKKDELDTLKITLKENIEVGAIKRIGGGASTAIDLYQHVQDGRVKNGVVVALDGGTVEQAHDIAVHAAFTKPRYLSRDEVPADVVAAERATFETIARNEGKPEAALPKIVDGRIHGFYKDVVLLDQPYVKDEKQSIAQLLGGATVAGFAQVVIGAK
jgi:elongation factor Ts